jgi:hypothetical protein
MLSNWLISKLIWTIVIPLGASHLTEIPEILLEYQMEHVNFCNAVSKISVVDKLEIPEVSKFLMPLKHFPTTLLLSSLRRAKTATKTKRRVFNHFSGSSLDLFRRMLKEEI